jgi:transposase
MNIHLAVDGHGLPMSILLTPGQAGTTRSCCRCSTRSRSPATDTAGHGSGPIESLPPVPAPTPPPGRRCTGAGSDFPVLSGETRSPSARQNARARAGSGRVTQKVYARRNVVERSFNRLKQFRGLATRYAERAAYYRAEVVIASFVLWLRRDPQDGPPR